MKSKERKIARILRSQGWSLRAIAAKVKCSKGSISKWICDIPLTEEQIRQLKSNQDKGRARAADHPNSPKNKWRRIREDLIKGASLEIRSECSLEMLKCIGAALYWAEGYTASRNSVIFANTDPVMIKLMMRFFRKICGVRKRKFRGKINIHPHLDVAHAEHYWSEISGIPLKQFNKPLLAISRASKGKRDTLPNGTFRIIVNDVACCSKIKGWIEGIGKWASSSVGQNASFTPRRS